MINVIVNGVSYSLTFEQSQQLLSFLAQIGAVRVTESRGSFGGNDLIRG